ncbi:MAG: hypothetical protein J2P23_14265, partial [Microlunatus sp.]|nr:hypothetical protein [Microlunatus sp.]
TGQAVPSHRDWQEDRRCRLELVQVLRSAGYSFDAIAQLVAGCTARDRTQTRAALATRQAQLRKQTRAAVATSELNGLINDLKAR